MLVALNAQVPKTQAKCNLHIICFQEASGLMYLQLRID